ncbi:MAG: hypothetical protein U0R80_13870 [Nocardioidaceae bacterium]
MRALRALMASVLAAVVVLPLVTVAAARVAPPVPWSDPVAIPGTDGLANPLSATAPDGTDVVVWGLSTSTPLVNKVLAKVRLPGRQRWVDVPVRIRGEYAGINDIVGTPDGDFWAVLAIGESTETYLTRLDTRAARWTRPVRLFTDQAAYHHMSPRLGLAGDGTLVVAAIAPPVTPPSGDPVYRIAVATRGPRGSWTSRFLSPVDAMASGQEVHVNRAGDVLVSWIQGYNLPDMTVRAATRSHRAGSPWKIRSLSAAGDSQRAHSDLAPDGTAAVVWSATSTSFSAARLSTLDVRDPLAPWVGRDLVTGVNLGVDVWVLAGNGGRATSVWLQVGGGQVLWSRHLDGSTLGSPVQLSRAGELGELDGLVRRPDGDAFVVYQRFTTGIVSLGIEVRTLVDGAASDAVPLTGDAATSGNSNSERLGVDAAGHGMLLYTHGDYPDTDYTWQAQLAAPSVLTGPATGVPVARAQVVGRVAPGGTVGCRSGYWAEAARLRYGWTRNGHPIAGATHRFYDVVRADAGKRLACRVVASNSTGVDTTLRSRARDVSRR